MKTADQQVTQGPSFDRAAFCTTRQAADRIGVSHRTVQMWVENGTLQAWKTAGGHRRIAVDSVERLLSERRTALAGVPRPIPAARPIAPTACARSVLIVDDDAILLRLYELEISTWGLDLAVRKASNGIEALIRIGEARPDILVSDLHMPGLDGFGMIRTLRNNPATASLPLVVVSGMDKPMVLAMGLPEDVAYLTKPAPLAALRAAVTARLPAASWTGPESPTHANAYQ
ncbi:response regulator [Massilia arenae]|uniref:Response regulator n=1 Tax=Massilia arenae TaxID=2603288 RepID=A0A5C7FX73_9BURK|nr:response regulator [Massilia arenae]TXG00823.1 response regulator [Massilia arenae]